MEDGAIWTVNLRDKSQIKLNKIPEVLPIGDAEGVPPRLTLEMYMFMPGDLKPGADYKTALHLAFSAAYQWDARLNSIIPYECAEDMKTVPVVEHECEEAIHTANAILQLQVTGNVQQSSFDEEEGLERCIRSKIQLEALLEHPYMKCLIKILGDPKYKSEIIEALIMEKEKEGYTCNAMGECIMPEDPEILDALMDNLHKQLESQEPVPVRVPFDDRERYCQEHQIMIAPTNELVAQYTYDTYEYGCNHWVGKIYVVLEDQFKLKWATEYVSYKANAEGNPEFVSREVQYTSRFNLESAQYLSVDWRNGERIRSIRVWQTKDVMRVVYRIEFTLAKKDGVDSRVEGFGINADQLTGYCSYTDHKINGEIVGWNVTNISLGTVLNAIDVKA
jgi:hypothetical protein